MTGVGSETALVDVLLQVALTAARSGAAELARSNGKLDDTTTKSSTGDLVTAADLAAERAVRAVIERERPSDDVIGEELGTSIGGETNPESGQSRLRWVIDPLDGTTNYVRGIPYWSTSVAVTDSAGIPIAGVIVAPALHRAYYAGRGLGAWREDLSTVVVDGEVGTLSSLTPLSCSSPPANSALLLGTGLSYDSGRRTEQLRELTELLPLFTDIRRLGAAALDLCAVADGSLDAFIESDLAEYDFAAGALIASEAGAMVLGPGGGQPSPQLLIAVGPAVDVEALRRVVDPTAA